VADMRALVGEVSARLERGGVGEIRCDVSGMSDGLLAIELLARIALAARRRGVPIVFEGIGPELQGLIDLAGLAEALPTPPESHARPDAPGGRTGGRSGE